MKLICYITFGYPSIDASRALIDDYIAAGCDTVEIDLPTPKPLFVNDLIRTGMEQALSTCSDYDAYLAGVAKVHADHPHTSIIFTLFESVIMDVGADKMLDFCKANAEAIIYVGGEHPEVRQKFIDAGVKVGSFIQYHLPEEEVEAAKCANGFIYVQAKPGKVKLGYEKLSDCIDYLKANGLADRQFYCGMSINEPEDVRMVRESGADGVFAGSIILKLREDSDALKQMIKRLAREARGDNPA